jgi:hypothetical protein
LDRALVCKYLKLLHSELRNIVGVFPRRILGSGDLDQLASNRREAIRFPDQFKFCTRARLHERVAFLPTDATANANFSSAIRGGGSGGLLTDSER